MEYTLDRLPTSIQLVIRGFIDKYDIMNLPLGRYSIGENGIFVLVQEYVTRQRVKFEVHRRYIDVQWVISGSEYINVCSLSKAKNLVADYDETNDIEFYEEATEFKILLANYDNPVVLLPGDVHQPCISGDNQPTNVRKLVFKIPVNCI